MFPSQHLCIQTACRQAADDVRWKPRPMFWFDDCCHGSGMRIQKWHKGETKKKKKKIYFSLSRVFSHLCTYTHMLTHSTSLSPYQPALQSSRSSFGSASCKGPSLGQQGGVQHPDSLSRKEACMANCVMRPPLKRRKTTQLHSSLQRGTWRIHSRSSASPRWLNERFNKNGFWLQRTCL